MSATVAPARHRTAGTRLGVRDSVLDVVLAMHADGTWDRPAMRTLASAADVSRQTLYDQFGNRDGVNHAAVTGR